MSNVEVVVKPSGRITIQDTSPLSVETPTSTVEVIEATTAGRQGPAGTPGKDASNIIVLVDDAPVPAATAAGTVIVRYASTPIRA